MIGVILDIKAIFEPLFYDKDWEANKNATWQKAKPYLDQVNKFIGDKQFALGYLTLIDFNLVEYSNYFEKTNPE